MATPKDASLGLRFFLFKVNSYFSSFKLYCFWGAYTERYVCQDEFHNDNWPNPAGRTAQDRADLVDANAHRVYLYSYHKNPCDCHWGTANGASLDETDFLVKSEYLENNNLAGPYGGSNTRIVPVFNGKFYSNSHITDPDRPEVYNDGNSGCDNDLSKCDFCQEYSGRPLNEFYNLSYPLDRLSMVEKVFLDQYYVDPNNSPYGNSENVIPRLAWFRHRLLKFSNAYNAPLSADVNKTQNSLRVFPNPASIERIILTADRTIEKVEIYSLTGELLDNIAANSKELAIFSDRRGLLILKVFYQDKTSEITRVTIL